MTTAKKLVLSATVTHVEGKSKKNPIVTNVTVRLGDLIVAGGSIGGKFTATQALQEFKKDAQLVKPRFKKHAGYESAKLAGLVG
jgi:thiamine monophosphate kinase